MRGACLTVSARAQEREGVLSQADEICPSPPRFCARAHDVDILVQLSAFLFVGGGTGATALASFLHLLAVHLAWQVRLCTALHSNPDPLLQDAVVR